MSHTQNGGVINGGKPMNGTRPESGEATDDDGVNKRSCLQKASDIVVNTLENGYGRLGLMIGTNPVRFMIGCLVICGLCGLGFLSFYEETKSNKLWVPDGAKVVDDKEWIDDNFPSTIRRELIIGTADNILGAKRIKALKDLYDKSFDLKTSSGITLGNVCVRAGANCIVKSILEVWAYDNVTIGALDDAQVLADIKSTKTSKLYGTTIDYQAYLSGIERDNNGDIISAKATLMTWFNEGNETLESTTESWENQFISMGEKGHSDLSNVYVLAARSAEDESQGAMDGDLAFLSVGYLLVIIFVYSVLGNYNFMEQRAWLTLGGFICIGLSIGVSIGLASAFQQPYGPVQRILPFLLLGIGVDDMFVIVGALNNIPPEERDSDIPQLVSKVLRHAGVSITVTSLTDFVAFIIGATTSLPGLRSFCIYAALGILALFSLQAVFFTACLAIDIRRERANRDACCFCIKHKEDYQPCDLSQRQLVPYVFKKGLARIVTKTPFKIVVIIVTLGLFGVNLWGFLELEQYFNPNWFIPDNSYASKYLDAQDELFPVLGDFGFMYCGQMPYYSLETQFEKLNELMVHSKYIKNGTTDSWFEALTLWLGSTTDPVVKAMLNNDSYPSSEENFLNLTYKLTTDISTRTRSNIIFAPDLTITASRFPFDHVSLDGAQRQVDAMDDTIDLVRRAGLSTKDCFPYSFFYPIYETNKIIKKELFQNLGLAMICVFIVGLILIANIKTTLIVFVGVIFTLIDVGGTMHFWDLTIETVTSIILILSIGLAVDYSAHIGHMFMRIKGTRHERITQTLIEIGPPVFYGGFSTFLAFILLAASNSYVFRTFFKVNFLVVLYGLYHGLIFIPVVLSLVGPDPYPNATPVIEKLKTSNQVSNTVNGVPNLAFQEEMKHLPDPPLHVISNGLTNHRYENGHVDKNTSSSSGQDQTDPEIPPHTTIVRF